MSRAFLTRRRLGLSRMGFKQASMMGIRSRPMGRTRSRARAQRAFRGMGNGRQFPKLELKFFDLDIDDTAIANTGTIVADSVNEIVQGTGETERIGRKCTIRSINWRFEVRLPAQTTSATASDVARIILYQDKQANGATAAVLDILETANYQSFNNLANKGRFRTLMDRTYDLTAQAGGGDGTTEDYGQIIISDTLFKKVNIPIEFSGTDGAIDKIKSNNIGFLTISRSGVAAFASKMRIRFSDL